MDRQDRRVAVGLEGMEGRVVPSTALKGVLLQGLLEGTPSTVAASSHAVATVKLDGTGNVQGVGTVEVSGSLKGTKSASGHVDGTLKLSQGKGSVTLKLESQEAGESLTPGPGTYNFMFTNGTGPFAHEYGTGSVDLAMLPNSFTLTINGALPRTR